MPRIDDWIHDAYLEDALELDSGRGTAVIPFAQESGWGERHPAMADPVQHRSGLLSRHYEVPLTRCLLVVEHATALDADVDWHSAMLTGAVFSDSGSAIRLGLVHGAVAVTVTEVDLRVLVTGERAGTLRRRVLRGWPIESDHRVD